MRKKKLVVITGAGVSAESGLATFRDSGGLWEGFNIEDVASPIGWQQNPEQVLDFYNLRRAQAYAAKPNPAHTGLAKLEEHFDVYIITQNVDDLHERGGSTKVLHLHGELNKVRSERNEDLVMDIGSAAIKLGDKASDGAQLRPHIVWFGEMVPMLEEAAEIAQKADFLAVIGTSLVVYPAASLVHYTEPDIPKYIIDPSIPELHSYTGWHHIKENATTGVVKLTQKLIESL